MAKNKIIFNPLSGAFDTITDVSDIENRDEILPIHAYENNALIYADGQPGVEDPSVNILGQKFLRDGWYFKNSTAGQSINWYFLDGNPLSSTFQVSLQKGQLSAYAVMTFDSLGAKPIVGIYSIPTGSGDFIPGFAHSRWVYQISNANLATITLGKKYLLYVGENPSAHPEIDHIPLDYIPFASGGDRLDTELILTTSFNSDGTEPANDVQWMVESLGIWSTNYKHEMSLRIRDLSVFDFSQSQELVKEPTGFSSRTTSTISFNEVSRQFTIAPTGATFDVYIKGNKYSKTSTSITIPNTSGDHYIYFTSAGVLSSTMVVNESLFADNALVAIVYWNADVSKAIYFGEERHGLVMDGATHGYLHTVFGARYISGCALQNFTIGSGSADADAQFSADSGAIRDEDILLQFGSQATIPVLYRSGQYWQKKTADSFPFIQSGSAGYVGVDGRIAYNQYTGGAWQLTEVPNNYFTLVHIFATNDINNPYVAIAGTDVYNTKPDAQDSANSEIAALTGIPFAEFVPVGTVILQSSNSFTNSVKAAVQVTGDGSNYVDFRGAQLFVPAGQASNHSLLSNLDKDDHIQYFNQARGDARYAQPSYVDTAIAGISASNKGTGTGVFASKVANDFQFKSLKAGTSITISADANEVTISSSGGSSVSSVVDSFVGDGFITNFILSVDPLSKENTQVYISGVYQNKSTYDLVGTTLQFSEAPPEGMDIEVKMLSLVAAGGIPDATASAKGVIKLAGDLGGSADFPTVPELADKAPLDSPFFTGTPNAPTPALGTNNTEIATTAFVQENSLPFTKWNFTATPAATGYLSVIYDSVSESFYSISANTANPVTVIRSIDGQSWQSLSTSGLTSQVFSKLRRVSTSSLPNGTWFALSTGGGTTQSLYKYSTSDLTLGGTWSAVTIPLSGAYGICYGGSTYVLSSNGKLYYSTNASTWTAAIGLTAAFVYTDVIFTGTKFVALSTDNTTFNRILATSTDGINWTETSIIFMPASPSYHTELKYFNGVFVSVAYDPLSIVDDVLYSLDDGVTWNYSNISGNRWRSCTYDPITSNYVIIGECAPFNQRKSIAITKDFINYKYATGALPSNATAISYRECAAGNGRIVSVAFGGSGAGASAASMTSDPLSYYEGFL